LTAQDGELDTRPMRQVAATDEYTLRGNGHETCETRFTMHGVRYAAIGWPGPISPATSSPACTTPT
jgi:alpha-L-rhamnosidase